MAHALNRAFVSDEVREELDALQRRKDLMQEIREFAQEHGRLPKKGVEAEDAEFRLAHRLVLARSRQTLSEKDLEELDTLKSAHALMEEIREFAKEPGRLPKEGVQAEDAEFRLAHRLAHARSRQTLSDKDLEELDTLHPGHALMEEIRGLQRSTAGFPHEVERSRMQSLDWQRVRKMLGQGKHFLTKHWRNWIPCILDML